jgi:hypothetical protein
MIDRSGGRWKWEVYPDLRVRVEGTFGTLPEYAAARGMPMSARRENVNADRIWDGQPEELKRSAVLH